MVTNKLVCTVMLLATYSLHSMTSSQEEISQALSLASKKNDITLYVEAGIEAIRLAKQNPTTIPTLIKTIQRAKPTPMYHGHFACIGLEIIAGHTVLAGLNSFQLLLSMWTLTKNNPQSSMFYSMRTILHRVGFACRVFTLIAEVLNRSLLGTTIACAGKFMSDLPYDYENAFLEVQQQLLSTLAQIQCQAQLRPAHVTVQQAATAA